jgi:hypothetical protein
MGGWEGIENLEGFQEKIHKNSSNSFENIIQDLFSEIKTWKEKINTLNY